MKKVLILLSILAFTSGNNKEYCDIKGNVKNPGVYEIKENYTIQDIINDAGGLKKNSYTNNINLSKKVIDEMVIYIFSKNEIEKSKQENICICEPKYKYTTCEESTTIPITTYTKTTLTTTTTKLITTNQTTTTQTTTTQITTQPKENKKININTATLEELITLNGLGESKAKSIIEYRNNNGLFNSIEDLLNVKGIGQKIFEGIKEFIEV